MEVALRAKGVVYEDQRILPITFQGHVIGEGIPDLVVWNIQKSKRVAVVVDLKSEPYIKEDHMAQVKKYIRELRKQVKSKEKVHPTGLVINFPKESAKKIEDVETVGDVQVLEVK